jgi:hypothetical protein
MVLMVLVLIVMLVLLVLIVGTSQAAAGDRCRDP